MFKNKKDTDLNNNIKILQNLKKDIKKIKDIYEKSSKYPIYKHLKEICKICDKILKEVSINQNKIFKLNTFMNYYIPALIRILEQYINIKEYKLSNDESNKVVENTEKILPQIIKGYNSILSQLFSDENIDIDAEIKVLLKELYNKY